MKRNWLTKEGIAVMVIVGILAAYLVIVFSAFFWDGADL